MNDIQFSSGSAKAIAVTGRQKSKMYLASQAQMAASAMAMFNKANSRAFRSGVLSCAAAMFCARRKKIDCPSACHDEWQRNRRGQKALHQPSNPSSKNQRNESGESARQNASGSKE